MKNGHQVSKRQYEQCIAGEYTAPTRSAYEAF